MSNAQIIPAPSVVSVTGEGNPNGVVTATGVAWYFDVTNPSAPTIWFKATPGTSSNDWIILGNFSNA